jgi:hypothetical protein
MVQVSLKAIYVDRQWTSEWDTRAQEGTKMVSRYLSLTCALLLPVGLLADSSTAHSRFAGVYLSEMHSGPVVVPSIGLSLGKDGTATVTEDAGGGASTLFGHWVDSGSQVTVTFDVPEGQRPEPAMVFQPEKDGLQAVSWNHASWGKVEPPPMKKGFKIKRLYWLTTTRP